MASCYGLPEADLRGVTGALGDGWDALRGAQLLVTGGTGFIGKWLLATVLHANAERGLGLKLTVLTRDAAAFRRAQPALAADAALELLEGDVRDFELPLGRTLTHVVHAATDVVAQQAPSEVFDTCVRGTQNVLLQARRAGAQRLLLLSSGAVYGAAPAGMLRFDEEHRGAPNCVSPASAYGEGKRVSELLCAMAAAETRLQVSLARCFAFVGPHLPLDKHFAIGNFIGAALEGRDIAIQGDGTPLRSYLYAADLALWLWTLLLKGESGRAYNVGGDEALSIRELAERVQQVLGAPGAVCVAKAAAPGAMPSAYLPALDRIANELGLRPAVSLDEAIRRTAAWHLAQRPALAA